MLLVDGGATKRQIHFHSEALKPRLAHAAGAYPGFRRMKRLGVFLLPLDWMPIHRSFPNNSPVPIYTPGWREGL